LATLPLGIVSFPLTPQDKQRTLPATFSVEFLSGDRTGLPAATLNGSPRTEKIARDSRGGKQRAVFAGMDCAMHQSGVRRSRPLAAGHRLRRRAVQQLQRSAPQCSAAARPTPADAPPFAGQLPPAGPLARTPALIAASDPQGRSSRFHRDEPSPQVLSSKFRRLGSYFSI
jgi:hypothetical protein